jgi:hypothetical protein
MSETKITPDDLKASLEQFYGSETMTRHWTGRIIMSEGVVFLAEKAGAHWLTDLIASMQMSRIKQEEFQVWKLVKVGGGATITCDDGNGQVLMTRQIEFTDFPLDDITLWLEFGTLMLPSER